jgi:glycosyltransferase involved in cell wall biosynthesis
MAESSHADWRVGLPAEPDRALHILQVSTVDIGGGAEKVAWNLFHAYRERGYVSWLAVGRKRSDDPDVLEIPRLRQSVPWGRPCWILHGRLAPLEGHVRGIWRLRYWLRTLAGGWPEIERELGREDFNFPGSRRLLQLAPRQPDVVHAHNLHGDYFDLRILPWLSRQVPVILTLHDAWLLSGHCAHSFDCERWRTGCGQCPDLSIYPAIRRDATAYNWRRKRDIYAQSRLYVATPSRWLMRKVEQSILAPAVHEARVIPNGIDLSVFRVAEDRQTVRVALGLPQDSKILLFAANGIRRSLWRDFEMMRAAVARVAERMDGQSVLFLALGDDAPPEHIGRATVQFVPYQTDPKVVARYYQASDVYVHAARADTFPNTVLEALACGTPVVATAVGGIPEQVKPLERWNVETFDRFNEPTGALVPPGDAEAMADAVVALVTNGALQKRLGENAAEDARKRFDLERQVNEYIEWYQAIIESRSRGALPSTFQLANAQRGCHALPDSS